MQIVQRYLIREVLKTFAVVAAVSVGIYLVVDFFEKVDNFLEEGVSFVQTLPFFLLRIPFVISQVLPIGVLLAVLIVLGLMTRNNELLALQSGGVSKRYLIMPLQFLGLLFTILTFLLAEVLVPITMARANEMWRIKTDEQVSTFRQKDIWIKAPNAIYHIDYFNPGNKSISNVTLNFFDDSFNLSRRIDAKMGRYDNGEWLLTNGVEQVREVDGAYQIRYPETLAVKLDLAPEDLKKVVKKSEEMSLNELSGYIAKIRSEGYDPRPYEVDWHAKLAFPAVCLVMTIIGPAIALRNPRQEGIAMGIAYGIAVCFCYWIVHAFSLSLGHSGLLPPFAAAWAANMVFAIPGIALLL
jgi:lipopolysaccharide export system permease protein